MSTEAAQSVADMIIADDVASSPILGFEAYSDTIVKMIMQSHPKFSIGIYGEWGTGKTTLMNMVEDKLKENQEGNIITIWFNAWRYEREEQFALIALMKTIAFQMATHKYYKRVARTIFRGAMKVSQAVGEKVLEDTLGSNAKDTLKQIPLKTELLAKVEKDTIYYDGLKKIEDEMKRIREDNKQRRAVVFIDDLDRCSPSKALEVFESIKVFLDVEGFVFVIGLSHVTITKLITAQYEKSDIKGADYIKKIIQIPIILPEWNEEDIESLVHYFVKKNLINEKYKDVIEKNAKQISLVVQNNPRDVKRFINNYIVAYEIHSSSSDGKIDLSHLLLVQALNVQWSTFFYQILVASTPEEREEIFNYAAMDQDARKTQLESNKIEVGFNKHVQIKLRTFKSENKLWEFLEKNKDTLKQINWKDYRRVAESAKEIPTAVAWDPNSETVSDMASLIEQVRDSASSSTRDVLDVATGLIENKELNPSLVDKISELKISLRRLEDEFMNVLRLGLSEVFFDYLRSYILHFTQIIDELQRIGYVSKNEQMIIKLRFLQNDEVSLNKLARDLSNTWAAVKLKAKNRR